MRILMIAPEPFFEPRGTPFSEYHRIRALADLGHTVDLVTYPFGRDVELPGMKVHRAARPPLLSRVKIGPSWAKVPLDALLALKALHVAWKWRKEFGLVHSHEEGCAIGLVLAWALGVPHLYDMHSSLPEQLSNFNRFSRSRVLLKLFQILEGQTLRRSRVVIVICKYLGELVHSQVPDARVVLIENAPGSGGIGAPAGSREQVRARFGVGADAPLILYTGTFEAYQGLDLLFQAMRVVRAARPDARLMLVGGHADQVATAQNEARAAGVDDVTVFTGEQPSTDIPAFLEAADILASPRSRGKNTPLKIYQYLRAGRPIVATNLLTHTQVLNDSIACLSDATPEAYGGACLRVLGDRAYAGTLSAEAARVAETRYTYDAYVAKVKRSLDMLADDWTDNGGEPV
jgi:glycosyltransferase involved in cell wall biosynthesis